MPDQEPTPTPPRGIRIAVALWLALAAFTVFYLIYLSANRNRLRSALVDKGIGGVETEAVLRGMITDAIVTVVVFGGLLVLFALGVRAGRPWAAIGVSVIGVLLVLSALFGGDAALCAVAFPLSTIGLVYTWLPSSRRWLTEMRLAR